MIRAVIFDCFGVLITDSLQVMHDQLAAVNPASARELKDMVQLTNKGLLSPDDTRARAAALFGLDVDSYAAKVRSGEAKNEPLLRYILTLRTDYKTALLSNIGAGSLHKRFSETELAELFDEVVASGEVGYAKPDPKVFQLTADRLGLRCDECLFTDDRKGFCEAAQATGMQAIVYSDFEQFRSELETHLASDAR